MISGEFLVVSEINGKKYVPYSFYIDLQSRYERDVEERNVENEALRKQIKDLKRQNTDIQNEYMKSHNDSNDEIRELKARISELESELEFEKNCYFKMDDSFLWIKPNEAKMICENNELKAEIQRLMEGLPSGYHTTEDLDLELENYKKAVGETEGVNYENLCSELQDQHQQDCILISNLNVTIDKLVDRYANLRKNVGIN